MGIGPKLRNERNGKYKDVQREPTTTIIIIIIEWLAPP